MCVRASRCLRSRVDPLEGSVRRKIETGLELSESDAAYAIVCLRLEGCSFALGSASHSGAQGATT